MPLYECQRVHLVRQPSLSKLLYVWRERAVCPGLNYSRKLGIYAVFSLAWGIPFLATGCHGSSSVEGPFSAEGSADVLIGRISVSSSGQFGSDFSAALATRLGNAVAYLCLRNAVSKAVYLSILSVDSEVPCLLLVLFDSVATIGS